jgi:Ca2+-binding RTX toxin-like protein
MGFDMPTMIETNDAAAGLNTSYEVPANALTTGGEFVHGKFGTATDHDWYKVTLEKGKIYTFTVVGIGDKKSDMATQTAVKLRDSKGNLIPETDAAWKKYDIGVKDGTRQQTINQLVPGGDSDITSITFTAPRSGVFYLDTGGTKGKYGLSAILNSNTEENNAAMDMEMALGAIKRVVPWDQRAEHVTWGIRKTNTDKGPTAPDPAVPSEAYYDSVRQMLGSIADVANITFTELTPGKQTDDADLSIQIINDMGGGESTVGRGHGTLSVDGYTDKNIRNGQPAFGLLFHEMGHMVGLDHMRGSIVDPTDYSTRNDLAVSVTNYNTDAMDHARANTPLLYDIFVLQHIYGANTKTRLGDTTYGFHTNTGLDYFDFAKNPKPVLSIWDAGGIDTLDVSGFSTNQSIDLGEGHFSSIGPLKNNVTVAYGAIIENAIGGSGDDVITGNDVHNVLRGGAGNDVINGARGDDLMVGGDGNDSYAVDNTGDIVDETGTSGTDVINSSVTIDLTDTGHVKGSVENLVLIGNGNVNGSGNALGNVITGNSGNNILNGRDGNDTLDGGAGADTMIGGNGDDVFIVDNAGDKVVESGTDGVDLVKASVSFDLGNQRQAVGTVENMLLTGVADIDGSGNELDNVITGNAGNNILTGRGGNDTLDGGAGADTMRGGKGNDTYIVDNTGDKVDESGGDGNDLVISSISYSLAGGDVENLVLNGTTNINATGNALNNVLTGNSGNNILDGGKGMNILRGGDGDDTYIINSADDTIDETNTNGNDTIVSSTDFDLATSAQLRGQIENLTLTGSANINGTGNASDNVLTGNSGDNVLTGLGGNDIYVINSVGDIVDEQDGDGIDGVRSSISFDLGSAQVRGQIENLTLTGSADLTGTGNALENVIIGNSGDNILDGQAGNDTLDGGLGADSMRGGSGNDIYVVDNAGDVVDEASGDGIDEVRSSIDFDLAPTEAVRGQVENLTLTGSANLRGSGNALDNVIMGNSGDNVLDGEAGNDTLDGGLGADTMRGGTGNDIYFVDNAGDVVDETNSNGIDEIRSSISFDLGSVQVRGQLENLTLTGSANLDGSGNELENVITGNSGNNLLDGQAGNDTLDGGLGADTMRGGTGNDIYFVDNARDMVDETNGDGIDEVRSSTDFNLTSAKTVRGEVENMTLTGSGDLAGTGNALDNVITGNSGKNTLIGNDGNDRLIGGDGDDTLNGGDGDDILDGGKGADRMLGGHGTDIFIVDNIGDVVDVGSFKFTDQDVVKSSVDFSLANPSQVFDTVAWIHRLTLTGSANINATGHHQPDILTGNSGNNILDGGTNADIMAGGDGDDTYIVDNRGDTVIETKTNGHDLVLSSVSFDMNGQAKGDVEDLTLTGSGAIDGTGNALNNVITGNSGKNRLEGGAGHDIFVFNSVLASQNIDTISDFSTSEDMIQLDPAIFAALAPGGPLSAESFHIGSTADSFSNRIIYDQKNGALFYDHDGAGGDAAVRFATLGKGLELTASNFDIR